MSLFTSLLEILAGLSLLVWLVLFFAWGAFWQIWEWDADRRSSPEPELWPSVTAIVPARNEAATIVQVVRALAKQDYPGQFTVIVVDDHSDDRTADIARQAAAEAGASAHVSVFSAPPLEPGWTGKLWAMHRGVSASSSVPDFFWFTDADVTHAPNTLRRLASRAEHQNLALTSLMVLLKADSFAECLLIPPFLYFFLMLYPPKWIATPRARTAGAAGGCILLRRTALEKIGGLMAIRHEVIDDCALAKTVKVSGGAVWMGLTRASRSLRAYSSFSEIRDMIARTAFTQLRYSASLLLGTIVGMALTFLLAPALTFSPDKHAWPVALAAWCLMTASFLPTVAFYRLSPLWAPFLPVAALFYSFATALSAVRYWLGRGAQWKGRSQAQTASSAKP
jgi:hopene-associated glycosyltransferase HpnB